jgi:hypothetical protein
MCCEYWTLRVDYDCPLCGSHEKGELQTHWMGDLGSCLDRYEIGQRVVQLHGIEAATLGEVGPDDFISICRSCRAFIDWGARIEDESVVSVWPYRWTASDAVGSASR